MNRTKHIEAFLIYDSVIKYIESQCRKVGSAEIHDNVELLKGHSIRSVQRILKDLVNVGKLRCDNASPRGYQLDKCVLPSVTGKYHDTL